MASPRGPGLVDGEAWQGRAAHGLAGRMRQCWASWIWKVNAGTLEAAVPLFDRKQTEGNAGGFRRCRGKRAEAGFSGEGTGDRGRGLAAGIQPEWASAAEQQLPKTAATGLRGRASIMAEVIDSCP